jgi:hypothetical protein
MKMSDFCIAQGHAQRLRQLESIYNEITKDGERFETIVVRNLYCSVEGDTFCALIREEIVELKKKLGALGVTDA